MRLVTVLVALYKAGAYLESKLRDLQQQTVFQDCNIILLNCQNLEGEAEIYAEFAEQPNVTVIEYPEYVRLYPTWNDGIKQSESKYILNSNVDDALHPKYIEKCTQFLEENHEYGIVSTGVYMTDSGCQIHPDWEWQDQMPLLVYPQSTAGPCPVWRRSLHDEYGYFNPYYAIGDAKMWEKFLAGGVKFGLIESFMVLYLRNPQSLERRCDPETGRRLEDIDRMGI